MQFYGFNCNKFGCCLEAIELARAHNRVRPFIEVDYNWGFLVNAKSFMLISQTIFEKLKIEDFVFQITSNNV